MADSQIPMQGPRDVLREELKEAPKAKGVKRYLLKQPHYRQGHYFPAGVVIEVAADEKPSVTWDEVKGKDHPAAGLVPYQAPELPEVKRDEDGNAMPTPTPGSFMAGASVGHDARGPEFDPKPAPIMTNNPEGADPKKAQHKK